MTKRIKIWKKFSLWKQNYSPKLLSINLIELESEKNETGRIFTIETNKYFMAQARTINISVEIAWWKHDKLNLLKFHFPFNA